MAARLSHLLDGILCLLVVTASLPWVYVWLSPPPTLGDGESGRISVGGFADKNDQVVVRRRGDGAGAAAGNAVRRKPTHGRPAWHFLVSSDCSPFQRWQVLTQIHSARSVGQEGRYTWIVSGCPEGGGSETTNKERGKQEAVKGGGDLKDHGQNGQTLTRSSIRSDLEQHFGGTCKSSSTGGESSIRPSVHFSPDYSDMSAYGGEFADGTKKRRYINSAGKVVNSQYDNIYRFNNKPNGLRHWAESGRGLGEDRDGSNTNDNGGDHAWTSPLSSFDATANEAVVLIDPDFVFTSKFTLPSSTNVAPGHPAAAKYGLGGKWIEFNRTKICGATSQCARTTNREVNKYYNAGPPYIIHAADVIRFSRVWSRFVPPTYDQYPLLYAEMFAYSMAAAHLDLKHDLLNGLYTGCMVGWPRQDDEDRALSRSAIAFIEAFSNGTDEDILNATHGVKSCFVAGFTPPPLLHYCKRYPFRRKDAEWCVFAKRRVNHNVLDCDNDEPLLPWETEPGGSGIKEEYWHAVVVCALVRSVAYAKDRGCASCSVGQ